VLLNAQSQKQLDGVVTDDKGSFKFPEVNLGKYDVVVSFIGYRSKTLKGINLTPQKPDYSTGNFFIAAESFNLNTVEVVGQQAVMENKIDKFVYNADKDLSARGGDASDVLRKVPMLSVDMDGNVSLRGSQNIRVLINNKPSTIVASSVAEDIVDRLEIVDIEQRQRDAASAGCRESRVEACLEQRAVGERAGPHLPQQQPRRRGSGEDRREEARKPQRRRPGRGRRGQTGQSQTGGAAAPET